MEAALEFFKGVVDRVFGGEAEAVGIEGAVFFSGQVIGFVGRKPSQVAGKKLRLRGRAELVAGDEAFGQKKIPEGGNDRGQQDADSFFTLVEKLLQRFEGQREVAGGNGVA